MTKIMNFEGLSISEIHKLLHSENKLHKLSVFVVDKSNLIDSMLQNNELIELQIHDHTLYYKGKSYISPFKTEGEKFIFTNENNYITQKFLDDIQKRITSGYYRTLRGLSPFLNGVLIGENDTVDISYCANSALCELLYLEGERVSVHLNIVITILSLLKEWY
jgi:hypothetical protein